MKNKNKKLLVILSDVNFSPQLIAILQEISSEGLPFRIILIGNSQLKIAQQITTHGWDLRTVKARGKIGSVTNLFVIGGVIARNRPNVVFVSGQFATAIGMLSSKLLNVPRRIFIRHHSNFHQKYNMRFGIFLDHMANRLSTEIVAVSTIVRELLIRNESVDPKKINLIYNGIDLNGFRCLDSDTSQMTNRQVAKEELFHIGVISRLTGWKGVEYAAIAFTQLKREFPNCRLHIVGAHADSYLEIKKILAVVNDNHYSIESENLDIPKFFRDLSAFVHVPIGYADEAFGIVYIEALTSGVPCIFTLSGVLNELENPEKYVDIVEYRDSNEIYLKLRKLLLNQSTPKITVPDWWLNQFSLEVMAKKYVELFLLEKK